VTRRGDVNAPGQDRPPGGDRSASTKTPRPDRTASTDTPRRDRSASDRPASAGTPGRGRAANANTLLVRTALVALGVLLAARGLWLLKAELRPFSNALSIAKWLVAGPLLHDLVVAPAVAITALLVTSKAPPHWRVPVLTGLAASGVLALIAVPVLLRPSAGPPNPGLTDHRNVLGLVITLAVICVIVGAAGIAAKGHDRAGGRDGFLAQLRRDRGQLHRGRGGRAVAGRLRARLGGPRR
jgi:hypothetical protein